MTTQNEENLLEIKNLNITFVSDGKVVKAVKNLNLNIPYGKTIGLVGESGSGKSVTSLAIMRLLPDHGGVKITGEILYKGQNLLNLSMKDMRQVRGNKISMIFQEPMTSLNPVYTVGQQIDETILLHQDLSKAQARKRTIELLTEVGIPDPENKVNAYPHEMSGGQKQRVMIAMAMACEPELLICDEPTTALDVTIQKQILNLIKMLQEKQNMSVILVTHDLGVVSEYSERLQVMYAGEIVETGLTRDLITHPRHPYTHALLASRPGALVAGAARIPKTPLPSISGIVPAFHQRPMGCQFNPRCEFVTQECKMAPIEIQVMEPKHREFRCIHPITEGAIR